MPECAVIIVNHNGRRFLKGCLESIRAGSTSLEVSVHLVDNNSGDGSPDYVAREFPWVELHRNGHNPGFAAANNQVLRQVTAEFIFLLNPDTVLLPRALERLIEVLEADPGVGCAAPRILNPDGSLQLSVGRFPTLSNQLIEWLGLHKLGFREQAEIVRSERDYARRRQIDWAFGAALMTRRQVVAEVGLLDEGYFFGSEERDWCYRLWRAGWRVMFEPAARLIHHGRGWRADPLITEAMIKGRLRFAHKHFSRRKAGAMRAVMGAGLLTRSGLCLARQWLAQGGGGSRHQSQAYWRGFKVCARGLAPGHGSGRPDTTTR